MERLRAQAQATHLAIAIDGPGAAGKSSLGRALADILECAYLDTGLMYRALTWLVQTSAIDPHDGQAVARAVARMRFALNDRGSAAVLTLDGAPLVPEQVHTPHIDAGVSLVSAHPPVREHMVELQRQLARGQCIVMLGRDIGTVVLPDAPVKLFVTASPEVRAERRHLQRLARGESSDLAATLAAIQARDAYDSSRSVSPMAPAADAHVIWTDCNTPGETVDAALATIRRALTMEARAVHG